MQRKHGTMLQHCNFFRLNLMREHDPNLSFRCRYPSWTNGVLVRGVESADWLKVKLPNIQHILEHDISLIFIALATLPKKCPQSRSEQPWLASIKYLDNNALRMFFFSAT